MDQMRTGSFLKALRRERGWTQNELAERLHVSEKTVSKWETGRGMPEVGLMLPLCELLEISVNELLSGERLAGEQYRGRAEENMLSLACDRTPSGVKVAVCTAACVLLVVVVMTLILLAATLIIPVWARICMIVCAFLGVVAVIAPILLVALSTEIFLCPTCGKKFVPTARAYLFAPHTLLRRRLRCPHCGKKGWCRSLLRGK